MRITTERLKQLRHDEKQLLERQKYAPEKVREATRERIAVLNEVLEYREAEEESEFKPHTVKFFAGLIPVTGTVS